MSIDANFIYDLKRKMLIKYKRLGSVLARANIEIRDDLPCHTAATDGKNIYIDPDYFEKLSEDERIFTLAHEVMHIKFMHMYRLKDKNGEKRDLDLWNIATDAIINANLERDGFTIKEGYVNMPEALNYTAEEFYQKLLEEKQKGGQGNNQNKEQDGEQDDEQKRENQQDSENKGQGQEKEQENQQGNDNKKQGQEQGQEHENGQGNDSEKSDEEKFEGDDHSMWEEAFKDYQDKSKDKKKSQKQMNNSESKEKETDLESEEHPDIDFDERQEFEDYRKEKRERFKAKKEKTQNDIRNKKEGTISLGKIGQSKETIDWKFLLRREVEKTETIWSQRRSIAENNYAYRLEENDIEDEAETEVMIDVSGSVQLELVKAFLRQIKPIIKHSKLKVGCFNEKFWGLVDIKSARDIDNFTIPEEARGNSAWTEDWDLAVRSFTKKREINKIVFTDGYPCPGTMPKEDLKRENVIWIVYGNEQFNPCCGKVIQITQKQLEKLKTIDTEKNKEDAIR